MWSRNGIMLGLLKTPVGEHQARFPANCEHLYNHLDEQTFLANTSRIPEPL